MHLENITGWLYALSILASGFADSPHSSRPGTTSASEAFGLDLDQLAKEWVEKTTRRMIHLILDLNKVMTCQPETPWTVDNFALPAIRAC